MNNRKQATHKAIIFPQGVKSIGGHLVVVFNIEVYSTEGAVVTPENRPQDFALAMAPFKFDNTPAELTRKMIDRTVDIATRAGFPLTATDVIAPKFA